MCGVHRWWPRRLALLSIGVSLAQPACLRLHIDSGQVVLCPSVGGGAGTMVPCAAHTCDVKARQLKLDMACCKGQPVAVTLRVSHAATHGSTIALLRAGGRRLCLRLGRVTLRHGSGGAAAGVALSVARLRGDDVVVGTWIFHSRLQFVLYCLPPLPRMVCGIVLDLRRRQRRALLLLGIAVGPRERHLALRIELRD
jgi:hypothetical protein